MFFGKGKLIVLVTISLLTSSICTLQANLETVLNSGVTTATAGVVNRFISKQLATLFMKCFTTNATASHNNLLSYEHAVPEEVFEVLTREGAREKHIEGLAAALAEINVGIVFWTAAQQAYELVHKKYVPEKVPFNLRLTTLTGTPQGKSFLKAIYESGMDMLCLFELFWGAKHIYDKHYLMAAGSAPVTLPATNLTGPSSNTLVTAESDVISAFYKQAAWTTAVTLGFVTGVIGFNLFGVKAGDALVKSTVGENSLLAPYLMRSMIFTVGIYFSDALGRDFFDWAKNKFDAIRNCGELCEDLYLWGGELSYIITGMIPDLYVLEQAIVAHAIAAATTVAATTVAGKTTPEHH